jgi:uncharacterized protein with PIN domain
VILDTNAVSAIILGEPGAEAVAAGAERHHLPTIVPGLKRLSW